MSASDPGLRRVCVHAGTVAVDLALPAAVPIATLIPSIIDILDGRSTNPFPTATAARYQLSRLGFPALHASTTLAQNDVRDGAVLVLNQSSAEIPEPHFDDVAEAVSATLDTVAPTTNGQAARLTGAVVAGCITGLGCLTLARNTASHNAVNGLGAAAVAAVASILALTAGTFAHRVCRDPIAGLTLSVIATTFAALAGLLAVPDPPGYPQVLLAAMAGAVMSVLAMRVTGCGVVTLTTAACFAVAVAVAALAGALTGLAPHVIGSVSVLLSLGLLEASARLSMALTGLSPQLNHDVATRATRADGWLTSLLAAFSATAATGALVAAVAARGAPRLGCITLAALTGAVLLLRASAQIERRRTLMFIVTGIATAGTTFVATGAGLPTHAAWITAATAVSAAAALYLGCVVTARPLSPLGRRGVEVLECLTLAALVPLTCWICGLYSAVRGLDLM